MSLKSIEIVSLDDCDRPRCLSKKLSEIFVGSVKAEMNLI